MIFTQAIQTWTAKKGPLPPRLLSLLLPSSKEPQSSVFEWPLISARHNGYLAKTWFCSWMNSNVTHFCCQTLPFSIETNDPPPHWGFKKEPPQKKNTSWWGEVLILLCLNTSIRIIWVSPFPSLVKETSEAYQKKTLECHGTVAVAFQLMFFPTFNRNFATLPYSWRIARPSRLTTPPPQTQVEKPTDRLPDDFSKWWCKLAILCRQMQAQSPVINCQVGGPSIFWRMKIIADATKWLFLLLQKLFVLKSW